jgi:hypothetical protein
MDEQAQTTDTAQAGQQSEQPPAPHAAIDIEQLAARVYQLFLAEARLAHARGERAGQRRKH